MTKFKLFIKTMFDNQKVADDLVNDWLKENPGIIITHTQMHIFSMANSAMTGNSPALYLAIFYEEPKSNNYLKGDK